MADREYDVVVAGAGMVGAAFAALLATKQLANSGQGKKLRIAVLEARPFVMPDLSESFDPRVVALTARSRKLLEDVGCLGADCRSARLPLSAYGSVGSGWHRAY